MAPLPNSYCGLGLQLERRDITPLPANTLTRLSDIAPEYGWFISIPPIYSLTPAENAGLRNGDQLLAYRSGDTWLPLPTDSASLHDILRGPQGSQIELRIARDGSMHDITVTRDAIALLRSDGGFEPRLLEGEHACEALAMPILPRLANGDRGRA